MPASHVEVGCCGVFTPTLESGYMCALFSCCYIRLRCDGDHVRHVLNVVDVALCSLKASVLNSGDEDSGKSMSAVASTQ